MSKKTRDFSSQETKPEDVLVTILKTFLKYHVLLIVGARHIHGRRKSNTKLQKKS